LLISAAPVEARTLLQDVSVQQVPAAGH
jgi:hypothetical protein